MSEELKTNNSLTKLDLSGWSHLIKFTNNDSNSITETVMGNQGVTSLSKALRSNTTLTTLDLTGKSNKNRKTMIFVDKSLIVHLGNKIDGNGAKALCETLKMNTTLKNLMMTSTLIHFDNIINIVYILFFFFFQEMRLGKLEHNYSVMS